MCHDIGSCHRPARQTITTPATVRRDIPYHNYCQWPPHAVRSKARFIRNHGRTADRCWPESHLRGASEAPLSHTVWQGRGGTQSCSLIMDKAVYTDRFGAPFPRPNGPAICDESIDDSATGVIRTKSEAIHRARLTNWDAVEAAEKEAKKLHYWRIWQGMVFRTVWAA